eukprot:gene25648-34220_t
MTAGLVGALSSDGDADGSGAPLMPQEVSQLVWLGLSPSTAATLEPYVTILPVRTTLNINTASAEAISASMESLSIANARQLVERRTRAFFKDLAAANAALPSGGTPFNAAQHGVGTQFFEVYGKLRLDRTWVEEHSLLQRNGVTVTTVWRTRGAGATNSPAFQCPSHQRVTLSKSERQPVRRPPTITGFSKIDMTPLLLIAPLPPADAAGEPRAAGAPAKLKHTSLFVASPAAYARAAVAAIGYETVVSPYWSHALQIWALTTLPEWLVSRLTLSMHLGIRKAGMKKEGKVDGQTSGKSKVSEKKLT